MVDTLHYSWIDPQSVPLEIMDLGLTMDYYRGVGFIFYSGLLQRSKIQDGRILSLGPKTMNYKDGKDLKFIDLALTMDYYRHVGFRV